jgi:hypothetical protein
VLASAVGTSSLPGAAKFLVQRSATFINRILASLQVGYEIVIMDEIKVGFVGLAADHFRQMLEEMAHAVTLGEIIAEI